MDSAAARLTRAVGQVLEHLPNASRPGFLNSQDQWTKQQLAMCRNQVRGLAPGPEQDRTEAACRVDAAQKRTDDLSRIHALSDMAFAHGGCVGYDPDTVTLNGQLAQRTFPGMSKFQKRISLYLVIQAGVCVTRNLTEVNEPTAGVTRIQLLIVDSARYNSLVLLLGKSVAVRGTLSHSFGAAYHHADLLLHVVR